MDDRNENDADAAERFRLDQEAFERLPPAVKLATLLKHENLQATRAVYLLRKAARIRKAAVLGAAILLIPHLPVLGIIGFVLITVLGGAFGYILAAKELGQLSGILLFGGGAMVFDLISFLCGLIRPTEMGYLILAWIAMISGGLLLAIWAKNERDKTEAY